jgi:hypothetical protein
MKYIYSSLIWSRARVFFLLLKLRFKINNEKPTKEWSYEHIQAWNSLSHELSSWACVKMKLLKRWKMNIYENLRRNELKLRNWNCARNVYIRKLKPVDPQTNFRSSRKFHFTLISIRDLFTTTLYCCCYFYTFLTFEDRRTV